MTPELSHSVAQLADVVKVLLCVWTALFVFGFLVSNHDD